MPLLQVIVLAIVRDDRISADISTAHPISPPVFGWQVEGLDFDIALHLGTLLAVLLYFARDWTQIIAQGFGIRMKGDDELQHNHMLLWLLAIGSIPIGIAGIVFKKQAETTWRNPFVIGGMLIAVGILMYLAENAGRKQRDLSAIDLSDAAVIGVAQALAVVPGTSRSGITISAGLFRNMTCESAARFSFLLSTPAIAAAAASALHDMYKHGGLRGVLNTDFLVGVAVSAITGCLVISWFLHYLRRGGLRPFVYYRIVFGIIVLALAFIRRPA
jgi:undecaprenyl-diphosphatase